MDASPDRKPLHSATGRALLRPDYLRRRPPPVPPDAPCGPPAGSCRRGSSRHARSPWAAPRPPARTDPDRRPAQATPRSRTRRGIPATRLATPDTGPAAPGASTPRRPTAGAATAGPPAGGPEPGLAGLPPLPVTRLPLRIRQRHDHSTPLRNGPVTGGSAPNVSDIERRRPRGQQRTRSTAAGGGHQRRFPVVPLLTTTTPAEGGVVRAPDPALAGS